MKIDVNSPAVNLGANTSAAAKKVTAASATGVESGTVDRTTFHNDSLSVGSLTSQAMQTPEIRQDQVSAISQSVQDGTYKTDASKTADAIVASQS